MGGVRTPAGTLPRLPVRQPVRAAAISAVRQIIQMGVNVSEPVPSSAPTRVSAIYINPQDQHPAFEVVDALDALGDQLGAFRAVAQLADSDRNGGEGLPQLRRGDLAKLITTLNGDLVNHVEKVRGVALNMVPGVPQGSNPV